MFALSITLHWRHNGRGCVSNHQPHQPFIEAHIKENIKVPSLAFVRGIHQWPVNSPCKWPVKWKMFPFDDVIMNSEHWDGTGYWNLSRWITRIPGFGKKSLKINIFFKISFSIWQLMWLQSLQWHHLSVMASEITGIMTLCFSSLFRLPTKKTSQLHITVCHDLPVIMYTVGVSYCDVLK